MCNCGEDTCVCLYPDEEEEEGFEMCGICGNVHHMGAVPYSCQTGDGI